jgi:hypothetical protein
MDASAGGRWTMWLYGVLISRPDSLVVWFLSVFTIRIQPTGVQAAGRWLNPTAPPTAIHEHASLSSCLVEHTEICSQD